MKKLSNFKNKKGFTLVEMLVVIAIFTIIATIALFDQGRLNSQVLLTNLTYDVALTVREAQSYGVGVRDSSTLVGNEDADFEGSYGVYFNTANPETIIVFNDRGDGNGFYDGEESGELQKEYRFSNQRGNRISNICYGTDASSCTGELNILFKRPNPEPVFNDNDGISNIVGPVYIVLKSPDGELCRVAVVNGSGQVGIEDSTSAACTQ